MDALIMAGGRGTRLDADTEKPLFEVDGIPMIDHVVAAVEGSAVDRVVVVVSPHTPATRDHLAGVETVTVLETPGEGYVADLDAALEAVESPALTVAADLPLLDATVLDRVIDAAKARGGSLTVCVPAALKRRLGASVDTTMGEYAPTGVNVVADRERADGDADRESTDGNADRQSTDRDADSSSGETTATENGPTGTTATENASIDSEEDTTPMYTSYDARLAVNVNRQADADLAEALRCE